MNKLVIFLLLTLMVGSACKNKAKTDAPASDVTKIEQPKPSVFSAEESEKYVNKGKSIANASFMALSGNLKKAMKAGGPTNAVKFCNTKASILVDSLMKAHHASIRRTTDKVRSGANQPTKIEQEQLAIYKKQIADNQPLKPVAVPMDGDKVQFFAPMKMKAVCLKCHGVVGETMKESDNNFIKEMYPADQATGYSEGQFRGIWSIQFDR